MNRLTTIIATLTSLALLAVACSSAEVKTDTSPTPEAVADAALDLVPTAGIPSGTIGHSAFRFNKPPSLDWQILDSAAIVLANHVSTTAAVETVPTDPPLYRPMHVLKFSATEYLNGTGPDEITIEVTDTSPPLMYIERQKEHATQEEALAVATALIQNHNADWDSRPAVLFLSGPYSSVATQDSDESDPASASSTTTVFTLTNNNRTAQDSFKYTVDSLSRGWLPASSDTTSGATGASISEFITNIDPSTTLELLDLRSRINELQTELNAGDGSDGYISCVRSKYIRPWYYEPNEELSETRVTISSGAAAESEFRRFVLIFGDIDHRGNTEFFTGEQASLFEIKVVDDDAIDGGGFHYSYRTTRPLVDGEYHLRLFGETENDKACNYRLSWDDPGFFTWYVTVTAPADTLHEAFFDPVAVGTGMGADGTNGVLKPTSFTIDETAAEITGLKWENNQAVLTLNPHVSLTGYALDFIELDGSVSLSLAGDDATQDSTTGTHTWSVTNQPWEDGDLLMLRISKRKP